MLQLSRLYKGSWLPSCPFLRQGSDSGWQYLFKEEQLFVNLRNSVSLCLYNFSKLCGNDFVLVSNILNLLKGLVQSALPCQVPVGSSRQERSMIALDWLRCIGSLLTCKSPDLRATTAKPPAGFSGSCSFDRSEFKETVRICFRDICNEAG